MGDLVHLEILGPRAGLDGWLATLQDAGCCHFADALDGLVGEPGVGRMRPRPEESRAAELRSAPLLELRALESVLPPASPGDAPPESWALPPGGVDEDALARRTEEALALATRIRGDLEALRLAEREAPPGNGGEPLAVPKTAVAARLAADGPAARRALDGLEDAEARLAAHRLLASTGHVAAARVYVPRERSADLLQRLDRAHAASVVARPLPPRDDAPAPHAVPSILPLQALGELAPSSFGPRAAMGTLAFVACSTVALLLGDGAVAVALLLAAGWAGWGTVADASDRRAAWTLLWLGLLALAGAALTGRWAGVSVGPVLAPKFPASVPFQPEGARSVQHLVLMATLGALALLGAYALLGGLLGLGRGGRRRWFVALAAILVPALLSLSSLRLLGLVEDERWVPWETGARGAAVGIAVLAFSTRAWWFLADAGRLLLCLVLPTLAAAVAAEVLLRHGLLQRGLLAQRTDLPTLAVGFLLALGLLVGPALTRWRDGSDGTDQGRRPRFAPWRRAGAGGGDR